MSEFTLILSNHLANLRYEDLSTEVIEKSKMHILDGIGNQVCGSQESGARIMLKFAMAAKSAGNSTVVTSPVKMWPPLAGLVNGTMAHSIEMDDAHRDSLTKSGSVIVPAAIAVAEHCGASGKDLILALVCGYEIMVRIGLAMNPGHRARGFHSTGTIGSFGAATVTAKLLKLNGWETANALGIAGTQSAGLAAFLDHPSMIKGFNAGKAAFNGIMAGLLAKEGFTGPVNILEGREGFCRAYGNEHDLEQITSRLGGALKIMEVGFKPHAACRYAHGPIDVVAEIMPEPVSSSMVRNVTVRTSPLAIRQSDISAPDNLHSAQGSSPYSMALAMYTGKSYLNVEDFKVNWGNPDIMELSKKIKMEPDEDLYGYMGRGCRVVVELEDGRVLENSLELPKGEPENPLSVEELQAKFKTLFVPYLGEDACQKVMDRVSSIDQFECLDSLMEVMQTETQDTRR